MRMSRDTILNSGKGAECRGKEGALESLRWRLKCKSQKWYPAFQSQLIGQKWICGSFNHRKSENELIWCQKLGEKLYVTLKLSVPFWSTNICFTLHFTSKMHLQPPWVRKLSVHPGMPGNSKARMSEWWTVISISGGGAHKWATVSQLEFHLSTFQLMALRCCKLYFLVYQLTHR